MKRILIPLAVALGFLAIWQLCYWAAGETALASPWQTFAKIDQLSGTKKFWADVRGTGEAVMWSMLISSGAGLVIGIALGANRMAREIVEPLLLSFAAVPKVTLYPLILLIFGLGQPAKVCFGVMHGIVPIIIFTIAGVRAVKPIHLRAARAMRLSPAQTIWSVWLPSALRDIVAGQRIGLSATLLGVLIGELFASSFGLGSSLMMSIGLNDTAAILAIILVISVFAILMNVALLRLGRMLPGND